MQTANWPARLQPHIPMVFTACPATRGRALGLLVKNWWREVTDWPLGGTGLLYTPFSVSFPFISISKRFKMWTWCNQQFIIDVAGAPLRRSPTSRWLANLNGRFGAWPLESENANSSSSPGNCLSRLLWSLSGYVEHHRHTKHESTVVLQTILIMLARHQPTQCLILIHSTTKSAKWTFTSFKTL